MGIFMGIFMGIDELKLWMGMIGGIEPWEEWGYEMRYTTVIPVNTCLNHVLWGMLNDREDGDKPVDLGYTLCCGKTTWIENGAENDKHHFRLMSLRLVERLSRICWFLFWIRHRSVYQYIPLASVTESVPISYGIQLWPISIPSKIAYFKACGYIYTHIWCITHILTIY